jgi:hypothetical protein
MYCPLESLLLNYYFRNWKIYNCRVITDEEMRNTNIVAVDVQCSNGVIHVIDNVLLPKL